MDKFLKLPNYVLQDKNLTIPEQVLFAQIIALSNKTGTCEASNKYLLSCVQISERTLTSTLAKLKKLGYISVKYKAQKGGKITWVRMITVNKNTNELRDEGVANFASTYDEGVANFASTYDEGVANFASTYDEGVANFASTYDEGVANFAVRGGKFCDTNIIDNRIDNKNTQPRSATDVSSLEVVYKAPERCCKENPNFFEEKEGIKSTENIIPENKLITLWNKFPMLSTHENRSTKVYKRIDKYLTDILNNNFKEYEFDKDWKTDNKIKLSKLNNITEEKIIEAIFNHVEKFKKENKPLNKKYLAKAFDIFLYNPITRKSQFLYSLSHSVENVKAIDSEIQRKHLLPSVANKVDTMINYKRTKISAFNRNKIYMNVNRICKEFEPIVEVINLQKDNPNFIYINSVEKITLEWLKFLDKKDTVKEIDFTTFSYEYTKFLEDVEIRYNLSVDTSPHNRTFLKTREDRVKEVIKVDKIENDIYGLGE